MRLGVSPHRGEKDGQVEEEEEARIEGSGESGSRSVCDVRSDTRRSETVVSAF